MENKNKKGKLVKVAGGVMFAFVFMLNLTLFVQKDNANNISGRKLTAAAADCKWKLTDCPGWGSGDYEACLTNGDGNTCSCGSVSRNCE
jgi:hypothetical protein